MRGKGRDIRQQKRWQKGRNASNVCRKHNPHCRQRYICVPVPGNTRENLMYIGVLNWLICNIIILWIWHLKSRSLPNTIGNQDRVFPDSICAGVEKGNWTQDEGLEYHDVISLLGSDYPVTCHFSGNTFRGSWNYLEKIFVHYSNHWKQLLPMIMFSIENYRNNLGTIYLWSI